LNKKRSAELGQTDDLLTARAINAEPWQPPPGMVKRQCSWCRYFFAAPPDTAEPNCPDCVSFGQRSSTL